MAETTYNMNMMYFAISLKDCFFPIVNFLYNLISLYVIKVEICLRMVEF